MIDPANCKETAANCEVPDTFDIIVDQYGKVTVPQSSVAQVYLSTNDNTKTYAQLKTKVSSSGGNKDDGSKKKG